MIKDLDKHLTDQEFFTYVKFFDLILNQRNLEDNEEEDQDEINVCQFSIGEDDSYLRFCRLYNFIKYQDIPVKVITHDYHKVKESIDSYKKDANDSEKPEKEKLENICKKIKDGKLIKFSETGKLSWAWYEVYESTYFLPYKYKISDGVKSDVKKEIDLYLENLINGKLSTVKNNYYRFDVLKRAFIKMVEEKDMLRLFGRNFVIKEELHKNGNLKRDSNFCLLQTIFALQHLEYLTVNNVWREREYKGSYGGLDSTQYFIDINITMEDNFISEINDSYKKENPKNVITSFNKEKGVLKFAGEDINLSFKGKETDVSLLMNTLHKKDGTEWIYNDEVFEDWKFNNADVQKSPKNKIYFAAKKINEKVAMKTKIDDFIEFTTEKVRINPRYNKIDE